MIFKSTIFKNQGEYIQFYNDYQLKFIDFAYLIKKNFYFSSFEIKSQAMKHVLFFPAQCAIFRFEEAIYSS